MTTAPPGSPAAAPLPPSVTPAGVGAAALGAANAARTGRSTPARMRAMQGVLAVAAVLLGLALVLGANGRAASIDRAERAAGLVVAGQELRAAIGRADAASVGAFLAGGVDQPEQRARYSAAMDDAAVALANAGRVADEEPTRQAIRDLGRLLIDYSGLIETARADNRQQLPLGAAYLRSAQQLVRDDITTQLDALRDSADGSFRDQVGPLTGGPGIAVGVLAVTVLALFALAGRWMAARTRRLLNPGLVAAGAILGAGLLWALNATAGSATEGAAAVRNGYDQLSALSAIRADAYTQQASATFALIDRGARDSFNAQAETAAQNVQARLDAFDDRSELPNLWDVYLERSRAAAELDASGGYDLARAALNAPSTQPDSVAAGFQAFDDSVSGRVESAFNTLSFDLLDAKAPVDRVRIAGLIIGVVAAATAAWGIQRRINDYR
ncbi:MAG: hypothetical protein IT196_21285 [Acidimicrobiales bacterium]|nr:hypothetical protein [Acidimicrobiales bacterium]